MRTTGSLTALLTAVLLLCAGCALADAQQTDAAALDQDFPQSSLQITGTDAKLHTFRVWVADNEPRRNRGLMFVKHMDANAGMLFIYSRPQQVAMWMKNTDLPLDMLFVAASGRVLRIAANTTPQSLDTIESGGEVLAVIELNAGIAAKLGIRAGAQVIHPAFLTR